MRGIAFLLLAALTAFGLRLWVFNNRHTVELGKVYRCSQPSESDLRELIETRHIRTVVNLRGIDISNAWYQTEARVNHQLGVSQEDIVLSANRLPPPSEIAQLIEVFDRTDYPILIHCKAGADRTGLASVIYQLLYTDATFDEAMGELGPWHGHIRFGSTRAMDQFLAMYETWLQGETHSPDRFRDWALHHYQPGVARSDILFLDKVPNPIDPDKPFGIRVQVTNHSALPWPMTPGDYSGVHLAVLVANSQMEAVYRGKAGLLRQTVEPGESIILKVAVPPLKVPGKYALVLQMTDAQGASVPIRSTSFVQFGDATALADIVVE